MARADESAKENCTLEQNTSAAAASSPPPVDAAPAAVAESAAVQKKKNPAEDHLPQQQLETMELLDNAIVEIQDKNADYGDTMKRVAYGVAASTDAATGKGGGQQDDKTPLEMGKESQQPEEDPADVTMRDEPAKEEEQRAEEVAVAVSTLAEETATEVQAVAEAEQELEIESIAELEKQLSEEEAALTDSIVAAKDDGMVQHIVPIADHDKQPDADTLAGDDVVGEPTAAVGADEEAKQTLDVDMEIRETRDEVAAAAVEARIAMSVEPQQAETVLYEDSTSEQWFVDDGENADDEGELIPIITEEPSDDDDDDDPVFVGTTSTMDTFKLDPSASPSESAKRKRSCDGGESDSTLVVESGSERGKNNSSSSSSSSGSSSSDSSSSSSSSSGSENDSDGDSGRRKQTVTKKARHEAPSSRAEARPKKSKAARVRRVIPSEYLAFGNVDRDGREFPILRGTYKVKSNRRAVFSGHWGFSEADFAAGGEHVSKFEYTSVRLHGRHAPDRRPFSGKYSGYFNFRQFSGKIIRIKEDQVELNFLKMPREDRSSGEEEDDDDSDDYYEENEAADSYAKYEVYGRGRNQFGRFLIRGYLNPAAGTIGVRRKYLD